MVDSDENDGEQGGREPTPAMIGTDGETHAHQDRAEATDQGYGVVILCRHFVSLARSWAGEQEG